MASEKSSEDLGEIRSLIPEKLKEFMGGSLKKDLESTDVVLLGSIARQEPTVKSDFDFFILQNGASPETTHDLLRSVSEVRKHMQYDQPGPQEVFGGLVIAANLYETIGLEEDTNKNITHRILLLTESTSALNVSADPNLIQVAG